MLVGMSHVGECLGLCLVLLMAPASYNVPHRRQQVMALSAAVLAICMGKTGLSHRLLCLALASVGN